MVVGLKWFGVMCVLGGVERGEEDGDLRPLLPVMRVDDGAGVGIPGAADSPFVLGPSSSGLLLLALLGSLGGARASVALTLVVVEVVHGVQLGDRALRLVIEN